MSFPYKKYGEIVSDKRAEELGLLFLKHVLKSSVEGESFVKEGLFYGGVSFELIENPEFNAVAFIQGASEYVGLYRGVTNIMHMFCSAFFCDPETFQGIGHPSQQKWDQRIDEFLKKPDLYDPYNTEFPIIHDNLRMMTAARMNLITYVNLLHHEMGHIVKCHIPYLIGEKTNLEIIELGAFSLTKEESLTRRVLELDADRGAIATSFKVWSGFKDSNQFEEANEATFIEIWAAAVFLLYNVMNLFSVRKKVDSELSTHPSPAARLLNAFLSSTKDQETSDVFDVDRERIFSGMREVSVWWVKHELPGQLYTDDFSSAADEVTLLRGRYNEIHPKLKSLQDSRLKRYT